MRRVAAILFLLMLGIALPAQEVLTLNWQAPALRTLHTYIDGNELSYPVLMLGGDNTIAIDFDYMGNNIVDLEYTVVHCDNHGQPSDLQPSEYINGFVTNSVTDYWHSINTTFDYVNYRINLPNDNVELLQSGCYMVKIFKAGKPDSLVAQTMFMAFEQLVDINAEVRRPIAADYRNTHHELLLNVDVAGIDVINPTQEIEVVVIQNGCPYTAVSLTTPKHINGSQLVYAQQSDLFVEANNEYRLLDLRFEKRSMINTNVVEFFAPYYHVTTPVDKPRAHQPYFSENDRNGHFMVYANRTTDHNRAADYVIAHLSLNTNQPIFDGDVYVVGAFNGWQLTPFNKMEYDFSEHQYRSQMVLKQGIYDYMYAVKNSYTDEVEFSRFEGSHFETENQYQIMVFYRGNTADCQRLVGYVVL